MLPYPMTILASFDKLFMICSKCCIFSELEIKICVYLKVTFLVGKKNLTSIFYVDKSSGPQAQTGQIEVLKEVNETQKQQIEELEDRVSKATKGHKEALEQLAEKFMELGDLENKCKEHEKSIEELEHEASELQVSILF